MKHFIFGIFLIISTVFYSQSPNIDVILNNYRNFFHKMNDNFVDEIDLEKINNQNKKRTIQQPDPQVIFTPKKNQIKEINMEKNLLWVFEPMIKQTDQGVVVAYCKEGYGAALAGLLPGDIFIKVDSVDCANYNLNQI